MNVPAWHLLRWRPVKATVSEFSKAIPQMTQIGAFPMPEEPFSDMRTGHVVWGVEIAGECLGVAWEWGEVCPGVVALADPLHIVSNVDLRDDDGDPVDESARMLRLNVAVRALDWQSRVCQAVEPAWISRYAPQVRARLAA